MSNFYEYKGKGVSGTFDSSDLDVNNILIITHTYGIWKPQAVGIWNESNKKILNPDDIDANTANQLKLDFTSLLSELGSSTWSYNAGNATSNGSPINITNYGNYYTANSIPLDYDETFWSVSTRPIIDYDITGAPLLRFDYSSAEYVGVFVLDEIPSGSTNLAVRVKVRPYSTAATDTNMGWAIKYIVIRDGTATTSIATQILGSTAFETTGAGDTTDTYEVALSTLSVQTGDTIACILYPDTTVTTPKQTDWMLMSVNYGVS